MQISWGWCLPKSRPVIPKRFKRNAGVHKCWYPNSWMVYDRKSYLEIEWNRWLRGTPISENLQIVLFFSGNSMAFPWIPASQQPTGRPGPTTGCGMLPFVRAWYTRAAHIQLHSNYSYVQWSKDAVKGFNYDPPSLLKTCNLLCVAIGGLV